MSLQTPSEVKVKEEAPVEVDSSSPGSPESISGQSDSSGEFLVRGKVGQKWEEGEFRVESGTLNDVERLSL